MKIIALEEHFWTAGIRQANRDEMPAVFADRIPKLEDLGEQRIRDMDRTGVDVQVISHTTPATQTLSASEAIPLAKEANDQLAAAISKHPDRFAGFATLPTPDPDAAAQELDRAVRALHFKGAMVNGRTGAKFLDDPVYTPILEAATSLDVPLYLHPTRPPEAVQNAYYAGFDPAVSSMLANAGWGWHMETGIHALRLILAGVFDRYPSLQVILGHWGEMVPFYLARVDWALSPLAKNLHRRVADYFLENFYATPSGLFTVPPLLLTLQVMGADRIMYSVDYPYVPGDDARSYLEKAPISPADKAKIAHRNAQRLLKLE